MKLNLSSIVAIVALSGWAYTAMALKASLPPPSASGPERKPTATKTSVSASAPSTPVTFSAPATPKSASPRSMASARQLSDNALSKRCLACEGFKAAMGEAEVAERMKQLPMWVLSEDGKKIVRQFVARHFNAALDFVNAAGAVGAGQSPALLPLPPPATDDGRHNSSFPRHTHADLRGELASPRPPHLELPQRDRDTIHALGQRPHRERFHIGRVFRYGDHGRLLAQVAKVCTEPHHEALRHFRSWHRPRHRPARLLVNLVTVLIYRARGPFSLSSPDAHLVAPPPPTRSPLYP